MPIFSSLPLYTVSAATASLAFLRSRLLAGPPALPMLGNSPLLTVFALDFGIQGAFFAQSLLNGKSEKFYDLSGSLTYLVCFAYSFVSRPYSTRRLLATAAGMVWASRLGGYLFERIQREGKDERFDNLKSSVARFAIPWFMQAVWIGVVGAPIYLINTLALTGPLRPLEMAGFALWAAGFVVEAVADFQKDSSKRSKPKELVRNGLWGISRHPNYAGEISLQAGLALAALPSCPSIPYALLALGSPVLTYLLLTKVSGIPMVEPESAKRHGKNWENYANKVPMLWPWGKTGLWRE